MGLKKVFLLLVILGTGAFSNIYAQQQPDAQKGPQAAALRQQIDALKIAHITSVMELTPEESAAFWPVYNKYWQQRRECMRTMHDIFRSLQSEQVMTDTQAKAKLDEIMRNRRMELDQTERMLKDLASVLSSEKLLKIFVAEDSFKRVVLDKTRGHRK